MELSETVDKQKEDIIKIEDHSFDLELIESIANEDIIRQRYEDKFEDGLYILLLRSLTHESFSKEKAKSLWFAIIDHMRQLNHALGRNVGIVVASLDYLSNITQTLSEPKIIEEDKSSYIAEASTKDELTGLYLKDVFDVVLKKEYNQADRHGTSLGLLMIDIDDFKQVNDTYGHPEGDVVLRKLGDTLNHYVRDMDLAARYGGEELAVIMPKAGIGEASQVAERIREEIERLSFGQFSVTVSIGVAEKDKNHTSATHLIKAADQALYQAKNEGKNRVVKTITI